MNETIDALSSTLSSSLRLWRGTKARPSSRQPAQYLELYEYEACPFCRLVREALTELDLDAMIFPAPHGGSRFRPLVTELGGKQQFPFLVDPNTGESMYESADIVDYLYRTYSERAAPPRLLRVLDLPTAALAGLPRWGGGGTARPSRPAERALELFSFESSPFSRRVRELLGELELPYLLRNTGKAMWQDYGPPTVRATLFPDLPVQGRNRLALLERTGRVQVPFLVDPNTGREMFESETIRDYLIEHYAI